jgi:hypothetical protein
MLRVLIILLPVALAIYALVDLVQTEDGDVQGLPKIAWAAIIVLVAVVGPLAWILAGKRSGRLLSRLLPPEPGTLGPHGARQVPPDDDVDFLAKLLLKGTAGGWSVAFRPSSTHAILASSLITGTHDPGLSDTAIGRSEPEHSKIRREG